MFFFMPVDSNPPRASNCPFLVLRHESQRQVRHSSFNSLYAEVSDAGREARSDYEVAEVYEDEKCGSSVKLHDVRCIGTGTSTSFKK